MLMLLLPYQKALIFFVLTMAGICAIMFLDSYETIRNIRDFYERIRNIRASNNKCSNHSASDPEEYISVFRKTFDGIAAFEGNINVEKALDWAREWNKWLEEDIENGSPVLYDRINFISYYTDSGKRQIVRV